MVGLGARLVVGAVLLLAGAMKLRDPAWPATAQGFGVPGPVVPLVPVAELVLGALLLVGFGGPVPALLALGLLAAVTALVTVRVRAGDQSPCGCFGATSAGPVTWATVARNLALVALAATALLAR